MIDLGDISYELDKSKKTPKDKIQKKIRKKVRINGKTVTITFIVDDKNIMKPEKVKKVGKKNAKV